jgi:hypothetical protein
MVRIAAVASATAMWPGPALAADELGLSNDGITWSSSLPQPLFVSNFHWVPGDRQESSFFVRNESGDGAVLDIAVRGDAVGSLIDTGDLTVEVRAGTDPWSGTSTAGRHMLVTSMPVAAGQRTKVSVAVALRPAATNQSQARVLELTFDVRLTQGLAKGRHRSDDDDDDASADHDDGLPDTGGAALWAFLSGAVCMATGAVLSARTRRERTHGRA